MMWLAFRFATLLLVPFYTLAQPTDPVQHRHLLRRQNVTQPILRNVYIIGDVSPTAKAVSATTGKTVLGLHTAIHIDGTSSDGPLRVQMAFVPATTQYTISVKDWGVANTGKPIGFWGESNSRRYVVQTGATNLTNANISNHQTGEGIVTAAWLENPIYRRGGGVSSHTFGEVAVRILAFMGLVLDPAMVPLFDNSAEYFSDSSDEYVQEVEELLSTQVTSGDDPDPSSDSQRMFDIKEEPVLLGDSTDASAAAAACEKSRKRSCAPLPDGWDSGVLYDDTITQEEIDELSTTTLSEEKLLPTIEQESRAAAAPFEDTFGQPGTATIGAAVEMGMGRTGGALTAFAMVGFDVAKSLAEAAGPLLVLLDMVNGNWVGAGLAAVGVALGIAATLAVAGPVGWIFGGIITAFFFILPLAWQKTHVAEMSDRQGILQYAFFGDSTHTGNEQCQTMGNPNCTAVFGPGVLSLVFGWNNFDSIAFLIQYNQGYAMALPEIADNFYNLDDPKNTGNGADQIATIECNNKKGEANAYGGWSGDDPTKCNHPTFQLNRALITLPMINQTADLVYNRIIPNPGGDCKLINDAANSLSIPEYNMTITGQPVAIACNLSAAEVVSGTVIPLDSNNTQSATAISSGNSSTDGQNGHQVAVPPPTPFQNLVNSTNGVCLSGSGGSICLPAGEYDVQRGSQGFSTTGVDTMTVCPGCSIAWNEIGQSMPHFGPSVSKHNYSTAQTPSNTGFAAAMASLPHVGANGDGTTLNISTGAIPSPPLICLFTKTDRNGDVDCYGPGGGNVTATMSGQAQSIAVKGGATAEIYAVEYGDAGSATVTSDILDLSQEVYGTDGNFNQKIVAMRVCDGECVAG